MDEKDKTKTQDQKEKSMGDGGKKGVSVKKRGTVRKGNGSRKDKRKLFGKKNPQRSSQAIRNKAKRRKIVIQLFREDTGAVTRYVGNSQEELAVKARII